MHDNNTDIAKAYAEDGFAFPVDIIAETEAAAVLQDLEQAEHELAGDTEKLAILKSYPDRVLPSFDRLIRNPVIIEKVSQILGPDLMVWSASLFDKAPHSTNIVSWHQDLTYWGLDDTEEVTCWIALSPTTKASGCMYFVPGSHKEHLVEHIDTFDENNLLSRGQEIAVEVDDGDGVAVELMPGQASLHHGHLFHSSGPNTTGQRRCGSAIRFIKPSMKQKSGDRTLVAHVAGNDSYGHFKVVGSPDGRLSDSDFALCREDTEIKRKVLYEGVDADRGKRY